MKIRMLKSGRAVTIHRNDGLRKRCDCQRRGWATCPHPWHFSFKWKDKHHRFPVDRYASTPIRTKDDARTEAERLRIAIREGRFPPASIAAPATTADLTFETFADKWREHDRADHSQKANDAAMCKRFGNLLIDGKRLAECPIGLITEDTIEAAFRQFGSFSGSTWNKYRDVIRMMQRWGVKKGYLARPWLSADNESVAHRQTAKRDRRLLPDVLDDKGKIKTPGEERRLLDKASSWLQRLIIAALETGMRRGELLSLRWADVSLSRGLLTVRAENAKSGKARQVPISPRLRSILAMIEYDPACNAHPPTAFVFGDRIGRQIKDPKKAWMACCKAAGITDLHFHDLRHEAGSGLLEAGWPLQQVQAVLGHADAKTTSTYLNATVQHLLDSMRRFGTGGSPLHPVARAAGPEPPPLGNEQSEADRNALVN